MTEEEAKTKWCPFVRAKFASTSDQSSCNREMGVQTKDRANPFLWDGTRCLASECMAWRADWRIPVDLVRTIREEEGISLREATQKVRDTLIGDDQTHGFCGLAGRPS